MIRMGIGTRRKELHCSFCRKSQRQAEKLIGGPGRLAICGDCVALCNTILEATPAPFGSWDKMSDTQLLLSLKPSEAAADGMRAMLHTQIETLRKRGTSWAEIGTALGISRQAAWERFS